MYFYWFGLLVWFYVLGLIFWWWSGRHHVLLLEAHFREMQLNHCLCIILHPGRWSHFPPKKTSFQDGKKLCHTNKTEFETHRQLEPIPCPRARRPATWCPQVFAVIQRPNDRPAYFSNSVWLDLTKKKSPVCPSFYVGASIFNSKDWKFTIMIMKILL